MITMSFWVRTSSQLSAISSSPLVSSIVTLYALILLYVPYQFMRIVFSPVLILTGVLLLTLLRLGAIQRFEDENNKKLEENPAACRAEEAINQSNPTTPAEISTSSDEDPNWVAYQSETESETETGFDPNPCLFEESFVQWNLRAPLEVIYEEYEGEEDEDRNEKDPNLENNEKNRVLGIERYPSLSRYYPESDSDNSSDGEFPATGFWDSPENMCFRWEEDDRDGLIEIALDDNKKRGGGLDFHVEEDNLIEIDISPTRNDDFPARNGGAPANQIQLT